MFEEDPEPPVADDGITDDLGEIVGGYRLEERIASGGMGHVYAATHTRLNRRAAIKVLSTKFTNDESVLSRFYHEAKIANDVRHPNIIDIFDFVELSEPRRVACVMELLNGPSLRQRLRSAPLSPLQASNVVLQISSALQAVHQKQVVHRDLKPDNVVIIGDLSGDLAAVPSVKLLDFGIAKSEEGASAHRTNTGIMLGTPAYMAPEQIAGEGIGPASDVYALGEILYEMIGGRRLFPGKSLEVLRRKLAATEPDCSLPPGTPSGTRLTTLIRACIQSDPRRRPSLATFNEGIEALRAEWLSGVGSPTPAPRATARELATVDLSPPIPSGPGGPQPTLPARPWDAPDDSALGSALRSGPPVLQGSTPPTAAPSAPAAPASGAPIPPAPSALAMFDRPPNRPPVSSLPPAPLPIPTKQSTPPRRWMTYFLSGVLVLLLPLVFSERLREEVIGEAIAFVAPRLLGPTTTVPAPRAEDWARLDSILAKVPTDTRESPEALLVQARVVARADRHHEYQEALRQITRALAQRPRDPSLMAEWVRVLAIARGSTFSKEDRSNAEALLSIASLLRPELPGLDGARAELALRDGRTVEAARRAQAALRKIPDQGAVRLTLAEAWSHTDPQRALVELELAERTEPGHRRADRIAARAQAKIGRPRAAFELLQKRLKSDPRNAAVLTLYGDLERMVGNPQKALARYEAAIAGEGEPWPAKIALGWTHLELRNFGKAEEVFLEATKSGVEGTGALAEARLGLARVALARGDRLVTNELKEALQRSNDPASRLAAAEILAAGGAFSTAEELLRPLTTDPLTARSAWLLLAKSVTARADDEGAEEARSKALEIAPGDPVLRVVLGAAAIEKGLHPRAQELIKGTALRDPRDLAAETIDVRAPLPRFLLDEVSARWKLAGQDPTHAALAETALAILALHQSGNQNARQHARRAVELDPTGARGARAVLVQAALSQGNPGEALAQAELWSKLDPELTGPHLGRARALSQLNRKEEALVAYERALQLDPSLSLAALERRALLAANDPRALAELLASTLNDRLDWPAALRLAFALGL